MNLSNKFNPKEAEKKIDNDKISDREKYLLSHKIETLKNISQ